MNEPLHPALLPLGLRDLLPPDAAAEALVVGRMMAVLESHGYQRVKPPLVEFGRACSPVPAPPWPRRPSG